MSQLETGTALPRSPWRRGRMPELMLRRVERILLVSTPYDAYTLEEDGLLGELIFAEYLELGLSHPPRVIRASSGSEALELLRHQPFDLVITMVQLGDMDIFRFSALARDVAPEIPRVLLVSSEWELVRLGEKRAELDVDSTYVWYGDARLFLAIIKVFEDRWNVDHDTETGGVGVVILIEDSVRYRSSLLPLIYAELVAQTRAVMLDGLNHKQKLTRLRARPKILVATNYEEGIAIYERFRNCLFGIVSDVSFMREGETDAQAGIRFISHVHDSKPDIPALVQSSDLENGALAEQIGVSFIHKKSRTLVEDLRTFMVDNFGFGEFVFRLPDRTVVGSAADLRSMPKALSEIPVESIEYHAGSNHFSNWLRARSEFSLATTLRPRRVSEFSDGEDLRRWLIDEFNAALAETRRGTIEDFTPETYDAHSSMARIGGGSLGGKARGLAFLEALLIGENLEEDLEDVRIYVPRSVVIGTHVFDEFLEANRLRTHTLYEASNSWIRDAFLKAHLTPLIENDLRAYLAVEHNPLAIRSSSLLEDSQYHPFAGVYDTHMLPNNHEDDNVRLQQLADAIKLVYASTFFVEARQYLEATSHRPEEERMAVILQPLVGNRVENYFYPTFAGVVRSYNFYPFGHMKPEEGVANVALGLGKTVVEGGESLRFCPYHPRVLPQLDNARSFLRESQRKFYAIDLGRVASGAESTDENPVVALNLSVAEKHGVLHLVGSVWSAENERFYDGINRPGARVVTFAHVLKSGVFPLAEVLKRVLEVGRAGLSGPCEIEFAVNLASSPREFVILQMRPYSATSNFDQVEISNVPSDRLLASSQMALGNGVIEGLADIVYVRPETFDAAATVEIAEEIGKLNDGLRRSKRPYLLIGPGRWGSSNRWLGIPVTWAQISAARVIIEASLDNFVVDPSQGSHFFHNLTSMGIAYLTINPQAGQGEIDYAWLDQLKPESETTYVRHVRFPAGVEARIDGRSSRAIVVKRDRPGRGPA